MASGPGVVVRRVARLEQRLCTSCRDCLPGCDAGALIWVTAERELLVDRWSCSGCGDCVRLCPAGALRLETVGEQ